MSEMPNAGDLEFDLLDRLHKSMRRAKKSAADLGADLGVHRNTIGNYLNGRTALDRRTMIAWAVATGVPLEWLEHGVTPAGGGPGVPAEDREAALARLSAQKRTRHAGNVPTDRYQAAA